MTKLTANQIKLILTFFDHCNTLPVQVFLCLICDIPFTFLENKCVYFAYVCVGVYVCACLCVCVFIYTSVHVLSNSINLT